MLKFKVICKVAKGTRDDVDTAVKAAHVRINKILYLIKFKI